MKYCEHCGAEMEDDAVFCDECGIVQSQISVEKNKCKEKKRSKGFIIGIIIVILLGILGGGFYWYASQPTRKPEAKPKDETKEELKTLKESIKWQENSEKVEAFKKLTLANYPDSTFEEALSGDYSVKGWKYGKQDKEDYWLCNYINADIQNTLIFYRDTHENINIAEYYENEEIQSKEKVSEIAKQIFTKKTEPASNEQQQLDFIISGSSAYKINDSSLDAILMVTTQKDNQIQVDINLADHTYNLTYYGEILFSDTAQFTLDAGEKINLIWSDANTLKATPVNGFSDESMSMMKMMCNSLNNKTYFASKEKKDTSQTDSFIATYMPTDGAYINSTNGGLAHTCEIGLNKLSDTSFQFSIWEVIDENQNGVNNMIFQENVATFATADSTSAVFKGQTYTLYFDCSKYGTIRLSGFDEALFLGNEFYNRGLFNSNFPHQ